MLAKSAIRRLANYRTLSSTAARMVGVLLLAFNAGCPTDVEMVQGVEVQSLSAGDGKNFPKKGDTVGGYLPWTAVVLLL